MNATLWDMTVKMSYNRFKKKIESFGKQLFRLRVRVREFSSKNFEGLGWVLSFLLSWTPAYRQCRVRIRVEGMTTPTLSLRKFYSKTLSL